MSRFATSEVFFHYNNTCNGIVTPASIGVHGSLLQMLTNALLGGVLRQSEVGTNPWIF